MQQAAQLVMDMGILKESPSDKPLSKAEEDRRRARRITAWGYYHINMSVLKQILVYYG